MTQDLPNGRYHRQMLLPGIGVEGQKALGAASVVVVGVGALGTVVAEGLVRAGVGRLILIDRDVVELTNLQRQTLFTERDAAEGVPKAEAAARRLREVNSASECVSEVRDVTPAVAEELIAEGGASAVVVDCTDNFQTRYLLNDVCVKRRLPLVYGGAIGTGGMVMMLRGDAGGAGGGVGGEGDHPMACLRCVFPDPPAPGTTPTCDTVGVLGAATGVIGNLQAAMAIRTIVERATGNGGRSPRTFLQEIDVWSGRIRAIDVGNGAAKGCVCCGLKRFEFLNADVEETVSLCGADAVQIAAPVRVGMLESGRSGSLVRIAERLALHGVVEKLGAEMNPSLVRVRLAAEGVELTVFRDGRVIVRGTRDFSRARSIHARFAGS